MTVRCSYFKIDENDLQRIIDEPSLFHEVYEELNDSSSVDDDSLINIDKSWGPLDHLLKKLGNNGKDILRFAILGSHVIDQDTFYLLPQEVLKIADAIKNIKPQELWSQFDGKNEQDKEFVLKNFAHLQEFYIDSAKENKGLVVMRGEH